MLAAVLPPRALRVALLTPLPFVALVAVLAQLPHLPDGATGCRIDL